MATKPAPNALKALQEAQKESMARAEERAQDEPQQLLEDLSVEECLVRLLIEMYASELSLAMGVMPDGMAVYIRLRYPKTSKDPHAGRVSFVVHNDLAPLLVKAVAALSAAPTGKFWKEDQYAR